MSEKSSTIRAFSAKRARYDTGRSFDDVLASFRGLIGDATAMSTPSGETVAEFEQRVKSIAGDSGFMLFKEIDHGAWLAHYGIRRKAVRLIFGNPLVAYTMLRHDIGAGLFAPVEILLVENEAGNGAAITYDAPSSLMVLDDNPPLLHAALALDRKLAALIERIV